MKTYYTSLTLILVLTISACNKAPSVRPPFSQVTIPTVEWSFSAQRGDTLTVGNGTSISIPANAFINDAGETIQGNIKVVYKEIQNVADQLVSGIPMKFGEPENPQIMESAVMFDIRAYQDQQEVSLAPNKQLTTAISSDIEGSQYDLFSFNEAAGQWSQEASVEPVPNPAIASANENIEKSQASINDMNLADCFILNYYEDLDVVYDDEQYKLKDKTFNYYTWSTSPGYDNFKKLIAAKIEGYGGFFMDTRAYKEVYFEGQAYNPNLVLWSTEKPLPDWLKRTDKLYYNTEIKPAGKGQYYITFFKLNRENWSTTKLYSTKANIKMPLAQLYSQPAQHRSATYDSLLNVIEQEKEMLQAQNKVLRLFNIRKMGIYNYDIIKEEERLLVAADVSVENQNSSDMATDLFILIKGQNTVIRYSESELDHFAIYPDMEYMAFQVINNNQIALASMKKLTPTDWSQLSNGAPFQINLKPTDYSINSISDVSDFLYLETKDQLLTYITN